MTGWEPAAILAATQLIGGLLGQSAREKEFQRQAEQEAGQQAFQMKQQTSQLTQKQQQGALSNLVEAYRSALLGR
jgi:hypothetical protein